MNDSLQAVWRRLTSTPAIVGFAGLAALLVLLAPIVLLSILSRAEAERELTAKLADLEAAGFPLSGEALASLYGGLPSDENAAPVYQEAFLQIDIPREIADALPPWSAESWPEPGEPFPEEWSSLAEELIEKNAPGIELLHEAAAIPAARFPLDFSAGWAMLIPHVSELRASARLLSFLVVWRAREGDWVEAVSDLETLFAVAGALDKEPTLISQLTRIAILGIGLNALEQALTYSSPPAEFLGSLQELVERQITDDSFLYPAMLGELAIIVGYLSGIESDWELREDFGLSDMSGPPWRIWSYWYAGGLARDKKLYLELTVHNIEAARASLPERLDLLVTDREIERMIAEYKLPSESLTAILTPTVSKVFQTEARVLSRAQCAVIGMAAERYRFDYGHLPADQDALVPEYLSELPMDPLTGDALDYLMEDSWLIISTRAVIPGREWSPRFRLPAER